MSRCCPLDLNRVNSGHISNKVIKELVMKELSKNSRAHSKKSFGAFFRECKFPLVHHVFKELGASEADYDGDWTVAWIDTTVSMDRLSKVKSHQRINHFPGMMQICRKDYLATNLMRMQKCLPAAYDFFPLTFCLPRDVSRFTGKLSNRRGKHMKRVYIVKPHNSCQGEGILLTKSFTTIMRNKNAVCQRYISKPLLMDGYKFDLRIYALVSSVDPLRIYVYKEGFVRLATVPYKAPSAANMKEKRMHLTNYSINKTRDDDGDSRAATPQEDCKRSFAYLEDFLASKGHCVRSLWRELDSIIVKTVLATHAGLKRSYRASFPVCRPVSSCFEVLGFDVLLDAKGKPYLLEVNHSPSLGGATLLDAHVKRGLVRDTLVLVSLTEEQINFIKNEEHKKTVRRLTNHNVTKELTRKERVLEEYQEQQELDRIGNFRKIFPESDGRYDEIVAAADASSHELFLIGANLNKFI